MEIYLISEYYKGNFINKGLKNYNINIDSAWFEAFFSPDHTRFINPESWHSTSSLSVSYSSYFIAGFKERPLGKYRFLLLENKNEIAGWCDENFTNEYDIKLFDIVKSRFISNIDYGIAILTDNQLDAMAFKLKWT